MKQIFNRAAEEQQVVEAAPAVEKKTVAPKFVDKFDEFVRVQEGDALALKCSFVAHPQPQVKWVSNGKPVDGAVDSRWLR